MGAAEVNRGRYLLGRDGRPLPALTLRLAIGSGILRHRNNEQLVITDAATKAVYADLVAEVARLLDDGRLPDGDDHRPVEPPDIAVLVGRHAEAADVQAALAERGIPAVVARGGSVLESPAADHMRWLLHALARPADPHRVRMFALSWFAGLGAAEVADLAEASMEAMQEQLRQWSEMLGTHSVADTFARVWSESGVVPRVLGAVDGDRNMTDLDHLVELLEGLSPAGRRGVAGLLSVLDTEPQREDETEVDGDISARRIASEAASVQVMTVWAAKGLEFPVVCLPTLWRPRRVEEPLVYVDPLSGRRTFDLSGGADWPDEEQAQARRRRAAEESAGERLRLLYVALTRAQHQTMVWWAQADKSNQSALAHVLFARQGATIDPRSVQCPGRLGPRRRGGRRPLCSAGGRRSGHHERVRGRRGRPAAGPVDAARRRAPPAGSRGGHPGPPARPLAATLVVLGHRRPGIGRAVRPPRRVAGRPGAGDEQEPDGPDAIGVRGAGGASPSGPEQPGIDRAAPGSSLADLPAGTAFGTMVHAILEDVDFCSDRLDEELAEQVDRHLRWRSVDLTPTIPAGATVDDGRALLVRGLRQALETPLGAVCGGIRLADLAPVDRLAEVSFDLRLAGDGPLPAVSGIGATVLEHLPPATR